MSMYLNQRKHKAMHCGYKQKPTKQAVNALANLYINSDIDLKVKINVKDFELNENFR